MQTDYHAHRRYTILNIINHLGSVSRKKLIELTDYRPASVTELVKELMDEGLVVEKGSVAGGPGRHRTLLELNKEKICAIGIVMAYSSITYVLSQLDGTIVERVEDRLPSEKPSPRKEKQELLSASVTETVIARIRKMIADHPDLNIVGIGLGDPLYDESQFAYTASLPAVYDSFTGWEHTELLPRLQEAAGVPVKSFSAVALPALAEQHFGLAKGVRDFVCVELSNGLGTSMICGGNLITGYQGRAGEFGHTTINFGAENRSMCYCGKAGCVEADAAFPYIRRSICEALKNGTFSILLDSFDPEVPLTVEDVRRGLDAGDILCEHYVRESARRIGAALANVVNLLNPELIILYGSMTALGDFFLDEIRSILRRNTLVLLREYQVCVDVSMENLLPLGAAAEMFNEFLRTEDYSYIYKLPQNETTEENEE